MYKCRPLSCRPSLSKREAQCGHDSILVYHLVTLFVAPVIVLDLLLQHYAVDAGLEEREDEAGLALEFAQAINDLCARRGGEGVERAGELEDRQTSAGLLTRCEFKMGGRRVCLSHVRRKALVFVEDFLLKRGELGGREETGRGLLHGCDC